MRVMMMMMKMKKKMMMMMVMVMMMMMMMMMTMMMFVAKAPDMMMVVALRVPLSPTFPTSYTWNCKRATLGHGVVSEDGLHKPFAFLVQDRVPVLKRQLWLISL